MAAPLQEPLIGKEGVSPGRRTSQSAGTGNSSKLGLGVGQSIFDFEEESGVSRGINPIKLKAMAMKMRHRTLGYTFQKKEAEEAIADSERPAVVKEAPAELEKSKDELIEVEGPDNLTGLKTIFMHPFCSFLIFVPLGILAGEFGFSAGCRFWLNFLALVPLAKILGDATEELAASIGSDTISGLLNASFGNAVEMIVAVQSLRSGLLGVVKMSLLGSVLSNILLVLGTAFLLGGLTVSGKQRSKFHSFNDDDWQRNKMFGMEKEQKFALKSALISMGMLLFSCMSFALPTIFNAGHHDDSHAVLQVSRIGACIVGSSYIAFIFFQLYTHSRTLSREENTLGGEPIEDDDEDEESASLTAACAIGLMFVTTVVTAISSEYLVDAIEGTVKENGVPEAFIGVILLPIAGNACEHASAIRFAMYDRPGLAIGIAVGSSTQVALFVVPFSVIVGWAIGQPLDLDFGVLNVAVVTLSVLITLTLLLDGRSNWLKGYILLALYVLISVLYWYAPPGV